MKTRSEMTQEEKLKMLEAIGKSGVFVAGDVVMEKNVQYEIGNVEAGGVGIQLVNEEETPSDKQKEGNKNKGGRPKKSGKNIDKAFIYDAGAETNTRLQYLYKGLKAMKWIKEDTLLKDFLSVFNGKETSVRVNWTGDINTLAELFRELVTRKALVLLPQGESVWVMVNARFRNKEADVEFGHKKLGATRPPTDTKDAIALLVKIMNPQIPIEDIKRMMQSQ